MEHDSDFGLRAASLHPADPVSEDAECIVCYQKFSRGDRIPRVLHCEHTFCSSCLMKLSQCQGAISTVVCPLCRWITCTTAIPTLPGSLYVNTDIWDLIRDEDEPPMESADVLVAKRREKKRLEPKQPSSEAVRSALQKIFKHVQWKGNDSKSCTSLWPSCLRTPPA